MTNIRKLKWASTNPFKKPGEMKNEQYHDKKATT